MVSIEALEKEIFHLQNDRLAKFNADQERFKNLEEQLKTLNIINNAQVNVNKLFANQIADLELRLKKEETKPLVSIPAYVPTAFTETKPITKVNKKWWQ